MSDIFDHNLDAFESRFNDHYPDAGSPKDRLFYHVKVEATILHKTDKAFLIKYNNLPKFWIPANICQKVYVEEGSLYVHYATFLKIIKQNLIKLKQEVNYDTYINSRGA